MQVWRDPAAQGTQGSASAARPRAGIWGLVCTWKLMVASQVLFTEESVLGGRTQSSSLLFSPATPHLSSKQEKLKSRCSRRARKCPRGGTPTSHPRVGMPLVCSASQVRCAELSDLWEGWESHLSEEEANHASLPRECCFQKSGKSCFHADQPVPQRILLGTVGC